MSTKTFPKEELQNLLIDGGTDTLEIVSDAIKSKSRWSLNHVLVFQERAFGTFYRVNYSVGSTEQLDESPFEYDPEFITCVQVIPVQRTVTAYEDVL